MGKPSILLYLYMEKAKYLGPGVVVLEYQSFSMHRDVDWGCGSMEDQLGISSSGPVNEHMKGWKISMKVV